jgi:hypothetical protein
MLQLCGSVALAQDGSCCCFVLSRHLVVYQSHGTYDLCMKLASAALLRVWSQFDWVTPSLDLHVSALLSFSCAAAYSRSAVVVECMHFACMLYRAQPSGRPICVAPRGETGWGSERTAACATSSACFRSKLTYLTLQLCSLSCKRSQPRVFCDWQQRSWQLWMH